MRRFVAHLLAPPRSACVRRARARGDSSGVQRRRLRSPRSTPPGRVATFEGRMRVRKHTRARCRCASRCRRARPTSRAGTSCAAAGFGKWLTSNPGVGRYVYTKRVVELEAPASYRTLVRFRWLDADGDRVASAKSTSAACRQATCGPNLRPLGVQAQARRRRAARALPRPGRQPRPLAGRRRSTSSCQSTAPRSRPPRRRSSSPASARSSRSRARRVRTGRC